MAHPDLVRSRLATALGIRTTTTNPTLAPFLGKVVRYKRELLTPQYVQRNGTVTRDCTFLVTEVQRLWDGTPALRGYIQEWDDAFGRPLRVDEVELVEVN